MPGLTTILSHPVDEGERSPREQEAAIIDRISAALRDSQRAGDVAQTRALEENRLLWRTLILLQSDPANALPSTLRQAIISLGLALLREMEQLDPDLTFLAEMNDHVVAGLLSI